MYNTCWEDPAVDRLALNLGSNDDLLVLTSAGCNVLDYALAGPRSINAVDMNPRQNALLELKIAGIRALGFEDYFRVFGTGRHPDFNKIYRCYLREHLDDFARDYWDCNNSWFIPSFANNGFYFHGLSGYVARIFHWYLHVSPGLRAGIDALLASSSLDEQQQVYESRIQGYLWSSSMNWILSNQLTMNMLGVPHPQRKEVESQHSGGVAGFIRESIEYVFRQIPLNINYFWRLYLQGQYSADCCPEYLKEENFYRLKAGLIDRITVNTNSVTGYLKQQQGRKISRFVLLDHMDWMSSYRPVALAEEWQAIFACATDDARIIFRSAHKQPAYLNDLMIPTEQGDYRLTERLRFHPQLAESLQRFDRVHTYAGFHIADVLA